MRKNAPMNSTMSLHDRGLSLRLSSTERGIGSRGDAVAMAETGCHTRAQRGVDVGPVVDHAALDVVADARGGVPDDIAGEALALCVVHHWRRSGAGARRG